MIANKIIDIAIWIYTNTILKILPSEVSYFPITKLDGYLTRAESYYGGIQAINRYFPLQEMFLLFLLYMTITLLLTIFHWTIKGGKIVIGR